MDYTNKFCPVCKKIFTENDDVVVCPECGTPHHRECYLKNEACFNKESHGTNADITLTYSLKKEEKTKPISIEIVKTDEQFEKLGYGEEDKQRNFEKEIFNKENIDFNPSSTHLIDGKEAVYYEIAVKKNQQYYVPQFMAMSNIKRNIISWNFFAFVVPFAWSFYRKLYKISAIAFALYVAIFGISGYYMFSDGEVLEKTEICMQEDENFMQNIALYLNGDDVSLTVKQQELLEAIGSKAPPSIISTITSVALIALRFILGIKANSIYMKSIKKTIDKGEKLGFTGDKLKMYIYRKKGVVPFAICVILGIFEAFTFYL